MKTNFERVKEFMVAMDQHVQAGNEPTWPDEKIKDLRLNLITEELNELNEAIVERDMVEVADALADLLYVVYGTGVAFNIDLDRCFREVHRSNMTKFGADGQPIKNAHGKIVKGPDYEPPKLKPILYGEHHGTN